MPSDGLRRKRIDNSADCPSCALDHTMADIFRCLHTALRHVFRCSYRPCLNGANGDGKRENDRKERFHSTILFVSDGSYASTDWHRVADPKNLQAGPARIRTWDQGIMSPLL